MDTLTKEERSRRISLIRAKNTTPDLVVRSLVRRLGYRFRLNAKSISPDAIRVYCRKKK